MELTLTRKARSSESTISQLRVNGVFECFMLEDVDRGLDQSMSAQFIATRKVPARTAIPTGRYQVVITLSKRFGVKMPLILDVKGFSGIRIHAGNHAGNTEGCPLTGTYSKQKPNWVSDSKTAYVKLFAKILAALARKEQVWITIKTEY